LFYPYGKDYIKYLNDEGSNRTTYDQWKNKNTKKAFSKSILSGNGKEHIQTSPK
jgi:hypothetical protein